jgi:hypothetical protein
MDYVPDQPLNPPERDYLQERIDRAEALADQHGDEDRLEREHD